MITIEERERLHAERGRQICEANGYTCYTRFENGRDAAITKYMFTYAIISDLAEWGFGGRWCYSTHLGALNALMEWDGEGEPTGWHRDPSTGRRRPDGDPLREYVEW